MLPEHVTHGHILLISTLESVLAFQLFSHLFPVTTLTGVFLIFATFNWGAWLIYQLVIYPFFLSPFRRLPKPKTVST